MGKVWGEKFLHSFPSHTNKSTLASGMAQVPLYTDDYTYGTVTKRYREVYVSGVFAYFQTEVTTKAYVVKDGKTTSLGTDVKIFEGNGPLLYNV